MTQHKTAFKSIDASPTELAFSVDGRRHVYPRAKLPSAFLDWVVEGRRAMYDHLEGKGTASFFGVHLPVVVTYSRSEPIPFNTGNKGVGIVPVPDRIREYCDLYETTFEHCRELDWDPSLPRRLEAVRRFLDGGHVSNEALVTLEIFEKRTFANLSDFPIATLHFTGTGPVYRSFQVNAVVEILTPEHPAYRFAFLSRRLFEYDRFHITQTHFPFAYLFHPVEVRDKTPYAKRPSS